MTDDPRHGPTTRILQFRERTPPPPKPPPLPRQTVIGATRCHWGIIDCPPVADPHGQAPGFYWAACPEERFLGRWHLAALYQSWDRGENWREISAVNYPATMGEVVAAPVSRRVRVRIYPPGELEGATLAGLEVGDNLALVGEELLQFRYAELVDKGTYDLSGLRRAQRGTSKLAIEPGAPFTLMSGDGIRRVIELQEAHVGRERWLKVVSEGQALDRVESFRWANLASWYRA